MRRENLYSMCNKKRNHNLDIDWSKLRIHILTTLIRPLPHYSRFCQNKAIAQRNWLLWNPLYSINILLRFVVEIELDRFLSTKSTIVPILNGSLIKRLFQIVFNYFDVIYWMFSSRCLKAMGICHSKSNRPFWADGWKDPVKWKEKTRVHHTHIYTHTHAHTQ